MIVVIDGPAGSGKSSTARTIAGRLNIQYLDSGALYRALTLIYLETGKDIAKFFEVLKRKSISFHYKNDRFDVFVNDKKITDQIRSVDVNNQVSEVAALPEARIFINNLMREAVKHDIYIAEGRDLGTVVFPDADLKFFMIADVTERTQRRHKELHNKGIKVSREEVKQNILERDRKDSQRKNDPLKKAGEAIEIDTTHMTFEQQVRFICSKITEKMESNDKT